MNDLKRWKIDTECRIFNDSWTLFWIENRPIYEKSGPLMCYNNGSVMIILLLATIASITQIYLYIEMYALQWRFSYD